MNTPPRTKRNDQCRLQNLNWGYQIVDPITNKVALAIQDTQTGPERSEACTTKAQAEFERVTNILAAHKLTMRCRSLLIELIQADGEWVDSKEPRMSRHWNTAKALLRRGLATRNKYNPDCIRLSDQYLNVEEEEAAQ